MTVVYHAFVHRQGSASKRWEAWCTGCSWHSEMSRFEDDVTKAGAEHVAELNAQLATPKPRNT